MAGIRRPRQLPPPGSKPLAGTSIVRGDLRMRVKHPMEDDFWNWLCATGWRTMHTPNCRRYQVVPEQVFLSLQQASPSTRLQIAAKLAPPER